VCIPRETFITGAPVGIWGMLPRFTSSEGSDVLIYLYLELVFDLIILAFIFWNAFERPRQTPLMSSLRGDGIGYFMACADLLCGAIFNH
jgi:hypothetical protein